MVNIIVLATGNKNKVREIRVPWHLTNLPVRSKRNQLSTKVLSHYWHPSAHAEGLL